MSCASDILAGGRLLASVAHLLREQQVQDGADGPGKQDIQQSSRLIVANGSSALLDIEYRGRNHHGTADGRHTG
jgi:hypothetical protein